MRPIPNHNNRIYERGRGPMPEQGLVCIRCGVKERGQSERPPSYCSCCLNLPAPENGESSWLTSHMVAITQTMSYREHHPGLWSLQLSPGIRRQRRAFLIRTESGNVLWDCPSMLDPATRTIITSLGGLSAIGISCPQAFGAAVEWSQAFGCPIHVHANDMPRLRLANDAVIPWRGNRLELADDIVAFRLDLNCVGGSVLYWRPAEALLTGDSLQIAPDGMLAFMDSWTSLAPYPMLAVMNMTRTLADLEIKRLFGAAPEITIGHDAGRILQVSSERHCRALAGQLPVPD